MKIKRRGHLKRLSYDERLVVFLVVHKVYDNELKNETIKMLIREYPLTEFIELNEDTPKTLVLIIIKQQLPLKVYLSAFVLKDVPLKGIAGVLVILILVLSELFIPSLEARLLIYVVALIGILKIINVTKWME